MLTASKHQKGKDRLFCDPEGWALGVEASGRQTSALQKEGPHCFEPWATSEDNEPPVTGGMSTEAAWRSAEMLAWNGWMSMKALP